MRTVVLLVSAMTAACSSGVTPGDAGDAGETSVTDASDVMAADVPADVGTIQCNARPSVFPMFDRSCTAASDCIVVLHQTDCCGTEQALGIRRTQQGGFDAAESTCRMQYPGCGCAPGPLGTDNGTVASESVSAVVVQCQSGMCVTSPRPMQSCGTMTCRPTQVCVPGCCGIDGCTPPPPHCVDVPPACSVSPGCSCFPSDPCPAGMCSGFDGTRVLCLCA